MIKYLAIYFGLMLFAYASDFNSMLRTAPEETKHIARSVTIGMFMVSAGLLQYGFKYETRRRK